MSNIGSSDLPSLAEEFNKIQAKVSGLVFRDVQLPVDFKNEFYTLAVSKGYLNVQWSKYSANITTRKGNTYCLSNFSFLVSSELALLLETLERHKNVFLNIYANTNLLESAVRLKESVEAVDITVIDEYFTEHSLSKLDKINFIEFISDYETWGGGKTINRVDYFYSSLLKAGKLLAETSGEVAQIANLLYENSKLWNVLKALGNNFTVQSDSKILIESGLNPLHKPFLLLAGISGTGKTRFVREQARATDSTQNNFCLVPVRPDWHEPSDLLGYTSRLSGHAEYVTTDVLTFIVKAWQIAAPNAGKDGMGEINVSCIPYWLCLDEMNLAPVEQYFADYLSVLESREFGVDGYHCAALLNASMLQRLITTDTKLQNNLGLDGSDDLWQYFLHHGISLPPNLIVAGTVNMDETTHGFSRKVIDRAVTLDFGEFFPNVYADLFEPTTKPVVFTWSALTHSTKESLIGAGDVGGSKSIEFLEAVNAVLKRTPFELAYRALNELLLQLACLQPSSSSDLQAIWDDFLMTKVLPRIDGDEDKLRSVTGDGEGTLLDDLESVLEANLPDIWNHNRRDYFRLNADGSNIVDIPCRSKAKLEWMKNRLAVNTFTSYWP